jgi:CheY-like chemotaxis protein
MATILIVDDDPVNRLLLTTILEHHGHATVQAAGGSEAFAVLEARPPDLIIVDLHMPHMDGFEFLKRLRADVRHKGIAVIVHSATSTSDALEQILDLYAVDGVLAKPSEPHEVMRIVDTILAKSASD